MTTLLPDQDTKAEDEKMKEPSRKWRNLFWRSKAVAYADAWKPEGESWSPYIYPSKEVAEQKAADAIRNRALFYKLRGLEIKFIGAFPVKE